MNRQNWVVHGAFGRVSQFEMRSPLTTHSHPQLQLMVKLDGADAVIDADGEPLPLSDHRAVLLDGWEPHGYQPADAEQPTTLLMCHFEPVWLAGLLGVPICKVNERRLELSEALRCSAHALARLGEQSSDAGALHAALEDLVLDLGSSLRADGHAEPLDLEARAADRRLVGVLRYMREHMDDRTTLDEVASRFGLSRPHLHELFRQRLGVPPHVCWNGMRMEYALRQLASKSPGSIRMLAYDLGFNSPGNFTRFFQSIQGLSPRDYQAATSRRDA